MEEGARDVSDVTARWTFNSLLGAMYLQMYWLMAAGNDLTRCEHCGLLSSLVRRGLAPLFQPEVIFPNMYQPSASPPVASPVDSRLRSGNNGYGGSIGGGIVLAKEVVRRGK